MNKFEKIIKKIAVFCIIEFIVLSFVIIYGLENGFRLWNWIIIIAGILAYIIFALIVVLTENRGRKKATPEQLIVSEFYKEQAKLILGSIDTYLKDNPKVANDLKLYWPLYKATLKNISKGKKLQGNDYGFFAQLHNWQQINGEEKFLQNLYDVLVNNTI